MFSITIFRDFTTGGGGGVVAALPRTQLHPKYPGPDMVKVFLFFMHFCPGTITTHAESINSDLQRGLDRRLLHVQH